ncbi:MAG: ABC transporter permease [Planctomycetota bacterium]
MIPLRLVRKNLLKHKVRFVLTVLSMTVAIFLLCALRSLVVALEAGVKASSTNRLVVQSSVSLFVYLPDSYEPKLREVEGVANVCRWNWFGGFYQEPKNFFAQFATDPEALLDVYPEIEIIDGSYETFRRERTACVVGQATAEKYGKKVGDTFPIIGTIFPRVDGSAWDFKIAAIYRSSKPTIDQNTLFFHNKFLDEALESGESMGPRGAGIYVLRTEPDADATAIMSTIDALYEHGPQKVQTTTEQEFQKQFVSMIGNVPFFVASIGGGVMLAILLAVLNTMLMSAREQTRDVGVLKALGFTDMGLFGLMLLQSLVLCGLGGALGILLAKITEPAIERFLATFFPNYMVTGSTMIQATVLTLGLGLLAGIAPALRARGLKAVEAMRAAV